MGYKRYKRGLFAYLALAAVVISASLPANAYCAEKVVLNLQQCIDRAVKVNAEIKGAEFVAAQYRGKQEQADAARYAQAEIIAYGSLSPRARLADGGRTLRSSTNINRESYDGVFGSATVQLIQPIYTFGKISGYREAAQHGVNAFEAGAKLKATDVALQVRQAYNGLLLARETKALLVDIKEQLDKATDKVQKQLDDSAPNVDQVDLFKLQTYQGEVDRYIAEADEGMQKAMYGLRLLINMPDEKSSFDIADEYLIPDEVKLEDFETYASRAEKDRLEFMQLSEGLLAREALIKVAYSDYYPQIFALGFYSLAGATNRDHLNNPYVTDEFNHAYGGAVLGLKWNVDFGIHRGKVNEAKAEYLELKMKQLYAEGGVPFQVKDSYLQVKAAEQEMKDLQEAYMKAKQWVVASLANFDLGVGEARDIADSVSAYARIRADYFRTVYNHKMALANLDHATGRDAVDMNYKVEVYSMDDMEKLNSQAEGL